MLLYNIAYLVHLFLCVEITGRIIGITYQNAFGAGSNQFFELLDRGECKPFIDRRRQGFDDSSGRDSKCHIVGIRRFGNDNFITWVETGHKSKEYSFRSAGCNDDVIDRDIDVEFGIITDQLFPETVNTLTRTIFQNFTLQMTSCIKSHFGGRQIGLADIQMINFYSAFFGLIG